MLSNCGHDERNKYSGGTAGDQTGTEYWLIDWYAGGWDEVLIHPEAKVREAIADCATKAAKNDHIGYDQAERLTFHSKLKAVGWYPEKITTDCEADCSSSSAACVIAAGHRCGDSRLQAVNPGCVTGNIGAALVTAGFKRFTASKYLTSDAYLPKGTVLNRSSGHVVVVVTDGSRASETIAALGGASSSAAPMDIASSQKYLNAYGFPCGTVDGVYGPATRRASIKHAQTALNSMGANLDVDGINGPATQAAWRKYGPALQGTKGSLVKAVQVALLLHGCNVGSCGVDGDFGSATASAVMAFQRDAGLEVDGIVGPATFAALF